MSEISYLRLLDECLANGTRQKNRTGIDTFMIPGGMMRFNLAYGFPLLTTKRMAFRQVVGELIGFIRGYDNAALFRHLGCSIWDKNANENQTWLANPNRKGEDDLGRIYGVQWRRWEGPHNEFGDGPLKIDQLERAINTIIQNPESRRNIVSAWNPADVNRMALPPCHWGYQFLVVQENRTLSMTMVMRSCDMFLGVPFNIASYALLLSLVAKATGYRPGELVMFLSDVHIYENHLRQVKEQLMRLPKTPPNLVIDRTPPDKTIGALQWLEMIEPTDIHLEGYDPHPPIKGEMAV